MKNIIYNQYSSSNSHFPTPNPQKAFTIVELLVVIVVIGILAAITIVTYSGISQKAVEASLQSDLSGASKQLKLSQVDNGNYPTTVSTDCNDEPDTLTNKCIKLSPGNTVDSYTRPTPQSFILVIKNGNKYYEITENSSPILVYPWLTIGTQTWAKANRNAGTMVTGVTAQTNNSILEKYCYSNLESNCTTYGALYRWDEAMQYTTNEGTQGICPIGSHIPSDNDWKILEVQLGMSQIQADATGLRGTDQGTQLKSSGSSGLNMLLAGFSDIDGSFNTLSLNFFLWSSSESSTNAWLRHLRSSDSNMSRYTDSKDYGFSVRCLKN